MFGVSPFTGLLRVCASGMYLFCYFLIVKGACLERELPYWDRLCWFLEKLAGKLNVFERFWLGENALLSTLRLREPAVMLR